MSKNRAWCFRKRFQNTIRDMTHRRKENSMFLEKFFKRKNLALVLGIFMFLSAVGISQAEDIKVRIRIRRANIREKPSLRSDIVAQVRRGKILLVERKEGEWYRVRLPLKLEGYSLPGYVHQSIVDEIGKDVPVSEERISERTHSDFINKYRAGVLAGLALPSEKDYGTGIKFGGNFYYKISDRVNLELMIQAFRSRVADNPEKLGKGKLTVLPIQLSVQGRFPLKDQFILYAGGGVGYYLNSYLFEGVKIPERDEEVKNALGFHFGGGADYFFSENIAANLDMRYCIVKTSGLFTFNGAGEDIKIEGINLNSFMLGLGFKYFF
jgi:opacity protein-like surface antigen